MWAISVPRGGGTCVTEPLLPTPAPKGVLAATKRILSFLWPMVPCPPLAPPPTSFLKKLPFCKPQELPSSCWTGAAQIIHGLIKPTRSSNLPVESGF